MRGRWGCQHAAVSAAGRRTSSGANAASLLLAPFPGAVYGCFTQHAIIGLAHLIRRSGGRFLSTPESSAQCVVTAHRAAYHEARLRPGRACAPLRGRRPRARVHADQTGAPLRQQRCARRSVQRGAPCFILTRGSLRVVGDLLPAQALPHLAHLRIGLGSALALPYPIRYGMKPPTHRLTAVHRGR
jgi:hypothetical protein